MEAAATGGPKSANNSLQRPAELGFDDAARFGFRERRQAVLERFQPARDIGAEDIGARRQELARA